MSELTMAQEASRLYNLAVDLCEQKPLTTEATHSILELFTQAIALDELNTQYWVCRADTFLDLQDYTRAIADYQQVLVLDPRHINAWINLGYTYEKLHQWTQALAAYDAAIEHGPEVAVAHYNRGDTLRQLDRAEEAIASYTLAIHICPEYGWAYLNRGHLLSCSGHHQAAISDYEQAIGLNPDDIQAAWCVAWLRFGRHMPTETEVEHHLRRIADLSEAEHSYLAPVCLALVALVFQHNLPAARTLLEQASVMDTDDQWDPPFWQGMVAAWNGDTEGAQKAIERALILGLPPLLLHPLYWLQSAQPTFFERYALPLLQRFGMSCEEGQR